MQHHHEDNMISNAFAKRAAGKLSVVLLGFGLLSLSAAYEARAQQAFKTPEQAATTLMAAVKAGDTKQVLAILGRDAADLVSSGDPMADRAAREIVSAGYDRKNSVVRDGGKATLLVGEIEWPFPIQLVEDKGEWRFDTAAGREEILYRRIGRNELSAVQVMLAYVDAQRDYAAKTRTAAGLPAYAQRFLSTPGRKDGLYWPVKDGEEPSPIGEFVVAATADGYKRVNGRVPFVGYYYKILTSQGPTAPGGAVNYVVGGNMIGGFALVAYPAQYGNSGVQTFLINHNGTVFEKDLGPNTERIASRMTSFNPDHTWKRVPDTALQPFGKN